MAFIFCLSMVGKISGQVSSGLLPRVNVSGKISDRMKWYSSIESRKGLYDDRLVDATDYQYILTDIAVFLSYKTEPSQRLNIGYTQRHRGGDIFHRVTQQYNIVTLKDDKRIGHRIATDQTFGGNRNAVYRLRYRVVLEKSLSGEVIDKNEFYMKLGSEVLWDYTDGSMNMEWRLIPLLGYEISKSNRIEFGPDYRLGNIFNSQNKSDIWLSLTWFISVGK
jgi:hypothetical protein